jgi:hypothetical protein
MAGKAKEKNNNAAEGVPLQAALRHPRICFERIIPDELDPERHVRRALRGELLAAGGKRRGTLDPQAVAHVTRMALIVSKKWTPGFVVRCRFLDGTEKMQAKVKKHSKEWEKHANVKLKFVTDGTAEVRISFYADEGSWSAVGRDALNAAYYPPHQPTMNFGWVRDESTEEEDRAVVLHEFGHALGCVHEHQGPQFGRTWNRKEVLKYFQDPPNYWSPAEIQANVLAKYPKKGIASTQYDPKSIMLYAFDAELFSDQLGPTNQNSRLSTTDKGMIRRMYPA